MTGKLYWPVAQTVSVKWVKKKEKEFIFMQQENSYQTWGFFYFFI